MIKKVLRPIIIDNDTNDMIDSAIKELGYKNASEYITSLIRKDIQPKG